MIGQVRLINALNGLIERGRFPRFSILCSAAGSGRSMIAKHIAEKLNAQFIEVGIKADEVRDIITLANKVPTPTVYYIKNADTMSSAAKNSLLKVTEEPPNNAYFIMSLLDAANTLETIRSRGMIFNLEPYTAEEMLKYIEFRGVTKHEEVMRIAGVAHVPGEVDLLLAYDVNDFYAYVEKVLDNIGTVSGPNAFKISSQMKFKDEEEKGYDVRLFMQALISVCVDRIKENSDKVGNAEVNQLIQDYASTVLLTSDYLQQLSITGVKKDATFDMWVLDMRKIWVVD